MKLPVYLGLLREAERVLAESFRQVADGHAAEPDVHFLSHTLAQQCLAHYEALDPIVQRYGEARQEDEPERLHAEGLGRIRSGPVGLLRDLQDVYMLASVVEITWKLVGQAAEALRDRELLELVARCHKETSTHLDWLKTRMEQTAPQALIAAQ
ncbi:hypothetical protein DFQ14_102240 [Halopolyspora algeriensis]|uniref:Ferritin-like metal-binding protein YciE n=1 Tax=Halopolyspora algeriensis TaxID=1500506 RepID=A0A368W1S1_9ACTN|nr:hypothetical protein [Halopolyspora algeriensis]RCW45938.1 hypothetical protein DFQ14_102240 [Halopolyspora algeriensis]TQM55351.1 hypothetical protein FHU43_0114 [Halopolyspora algeriensis]